MRWFRRGGTDDVDVASCLQNLDRLAAVEASGLIGAPPDARLDGLTRLAAERLDVPMAFMSVIDDRRAHWVSVQDPGGLGLLPEPSTAAEETYCQFVVASGEPLIVGDSRHDDRIPDHLTNSSPVRSYLGVPLRSDDQVLGSFCVVDTRARDWSADELAQLEELASTALEASHHR